MKIRISDTGKWNYTNSGQSTVTAGTVVAFGNQQIGVVIADIAAGATGVVATTGIYKLPKDNNLVISQGDLVYWDSGNTWVDKTAAAQCYAGICAKSATQTSTTCHVDINKATKLVVAP